MGHRIASHQIFEPNPAPGRHTVIILAPLRTPAVFCILTMALAGWLTVWIMVPNPLYGYNPDAQYRPIHFAVQYAAGNRPSWSNRRPPQTWTDSASCVALLEDGPVLCAIKKKGAGWVTELTGETVIAAGYPTYDFSLDEFGLFAPVVLRRSTSTNILPIADVPLIDRASAIDGWNRDQFCGYGMIREIDRVEFSLNRAALAHDTFFVLTLLAWLSSLMSIPGWLIWRRLTPAQRRRARGACPRCGYCLEGLPSPTCPECGNTMAQQPVS